MTSIPNKIHFQSALKKLEMSDCKGSVSPKLDKACIDGDNEELSEEQTSRFRSSMLTLLYLSNERMDIQSTVRLLCTKFKIPSVFELRQLKRLLSEIRQGYRRHVNRVLRCVIAMTGENSWSNDSRSTQTLSGRVIKRHVKARVVR